MAASMLSRHVLKSASRCFAASCYGYQNRMLSLTQIRRNSPVDYYAVLGITKAATTEQVKVAYFKKAKHFHPDSNPTEDAKYMFQLIAEAYDVLSDEKRRKLFDETGSAGVTFGGTAGGPQRPRDHTNMDSEEMYEKIFRESMRSSDHGIDIEDHSTSLYGHDGGKEYKVRFVKHFQC